MNAAPIPPPDAWAETPPEPYAEASARKEAYRAYPLDLARPESAEPLVEATNHGLAGRNHYAAPVNPPYDGTVPGSVDALWVRAGVLTRLKAAQDSLAPFGLRLFLHDAWRPQAVQRYFHDVWFPNWLRRNRPEIAEADLPATVAQYWAAPSAGAASPSPHSTGGAVDLTLAHADGTPVWFGALFDDVTEIAHTDYFERRRLLSMSDIEARRNRRILYWAMRAAGFQNTPNEFWHFCHGDQMWAKMSGAPTAVYGAAEITAQSPAPVPVLSGATGA